MVAGEEDTPVTVRRFGEGKVIGERENGDSGSWDVYIDGDCGLVGNCVVSGVGDVIVLGVDLAGPLGRDSAGYGGYSNGNTFVVLERDEVILEIKILVGEVPEDESDDEGVCIGVVVRDGHIYFGRDEEIGGGGCGGCLCGDGADPEVETEGDGDGYGQEENGRDNLRKGAVHWKIR